MAALALIGCAGQPKKTQTPAAAQAQPPKQGPSQPAPSPPREDTLASLHETVHALSTEQWQDARKTGARALHELAGAIGKSGGAPLAARAKKLRQLADDVGRAGALDFAEKTRVALASAVDAIEALGAGGRAAGLEGWTASARKAVQDISTRTPFELQRAAIQDAFRAVVDAYGVTSGAACAAKASR